jgi:hypothetical protein
MTPEYACFISYRHGQGDLAAKIITNLYTGLAGELELLLDKGVYLDRERMTGGYLYNQALARALCNSACMIIVFTPTYFDSTHTYCAREYKAMEAIEQYRLDLLQEPDRERGFIIPIVFRGERFVPTELKQRRLYYDFSKYMLFSEDMNRHPDYAPAIKEIAEYIYDRYLVLTKLAHNSTNCDSYTLPSEEDVRPWLSRFSTPASPFPGRTGA